MKMATVDIIIPFFNTPARYVRTALDSVVAQTCAGWRAVLVDDGSGEPSAAEAEALVGSYRDARLIYLRVPHRGLPAARNAGIARTEAPYIALLDSDDAWYPRKLERQLDLFRKQPGIDVVYANCEVIDSEDRVVGVGRRKLHLNGLTREQLFAEMLKQNFVPVITAVFRRRAGQAVGFFNENMLDLEDKDFWLRLLHSGSCFVYQDEVLARYRVHAGNMSKKTENRQQGRFRLIETAEALVAGDPALRRINWPKLRRYMLRHAYQEAAEGYLDEKQYLRALKLSSPLYRGFSVAGCLLMARAAWKLVSTPAEDNGSAERERLRP
jgi:glycosyltransferase involved in cell wall biosynthesis